MSEKVVITQEQAEAIELFFERKWDKQSILKGHMDDAPPWKEFKGINGMEFGNLVLALYIGYEVEPSPEETILKRYREAKHLSTHGGFIEYNKGTVDAIEMVLRTLKIEIEGIHK